MKHYDVVVIGAGSAGLVAATTALRLGARTALVEHRKVGGECLHSGCVPSKALVHAARVYHEMTHAGHLGLPRVTAPVEFPRVMEHVRGVVDGIFEHENPAVFRTMGIDVHEAAAVFESASSLRIGDELVGFGRAIVCTGSSPLVPLIPGLANTPYLTNENVWAIDQLPSSILFVGAGPISVELGQAFARFGSRVTLVEMLERVLPNEDEDTSEAIRGLLEREGIGFRLSARVSRVEHQERETSVSIEQGGRTETLSVAKVFVSVGRRPNIDGLGLERAGVHHSPRGIEVNGFLRTTAPQIYACGDVVGPLRFTHTAGYQADVAIRNALSTDSIAQDLSVTPWVTFSDPECARVGLTEREARAAHGDIRVLRVRADSVDRPRTESRAEGFLKILLDTSDQIVGAHAVAAHAGEFIHEIVLAMRHGLGIGAIASTIHAYPTYAELVRKAAVRHMRTREAVGGP
jgi:pyruvate/2-oxoglutarate dehydrogenase complex dihydrolipoamide dehydrogenase (E3) component